MDSPDWDSEQRRLLTELGRVDMAPQLWNRLESVVRQWIDEQREADRRWQLHSQSRGGT
jgi:outer membrane lipopolysaccharide assembly protein LptE/RlpB